MADRFAALVEALEVDPGLLIRMRDALPENQPLTREMFARAVRQVGLDFEPADLPDLYKGEPVADAVLGRVVGGALQPVLSAPGTPTKRVPMTSFWNFLFG